MNISNDGKDDEVEFQEVNLEKYESVFTDSCGDDWPLKIMIGSKTLFLHLLDLQTGDTYKIIEGTLKMNPNIIRWLEVTYME